jgi:IS30 family transposase
MKNYHQLTQEEREKISMLRQSKSSVTEIALALDRSKSTISRELKRNEAPPGQYWPDTAQTLTLKRRKRGSRLDREEALKECVITKLCCHYWTPEQIAGWLKHRQRKLKPISHESIYAWLYSPAQKKEKLWKFLLRHKSRRGLRKSKGAGVSRIPHRVPIQNRPKSVENKREFGHWEGDLMSFMKNSQHILVLRERKTMFTLSTPLPSKQSGITAQAIIDMMKEVPPESRKTITYDNGGEFAKHVHVSQALGLSSYFCDPYASWQKGGR